MEQQRKKIADRQLVPIHQQMTWRVLQPNTDNQENTVDTIEQSMVSERLRALSQNALKKFSATLTPRLFSKRHGHTLLACCWSMSTTTSSMSRRREHIKLALQQASQPS